MEEKGACGCLLGAIVFNLALGGFSVAYCVEFLFGKHLPIWVDVVAGLFLGEFTVPAMVLAWVLKLCGVHHPLFQLVL
jgi:hypothetical protein